MDEFKYHPLFFAGATWDGAEDWNDPAKWESSYTTSKEPFNPKKMGREGLNFGRFDLYAAQDLGAFAGLPRSEGESPLRVLDAGSGLSNLPELLARLGGLVTAIDFSPTAVRLAEELQAHRSRWRLADRVADVLGPELTGRMPIATDPPGRVDYRVADWFDDSLEPGSFEAVLVCNSLRLARKAYWRRSLIRFRELLVPGGLLVTNSLNARAVSFEVTDLAKELGFDILGWSVDESDPSHRQPVDPSRPRYLGLWPTG